MAPGNMNPGDWDRVTDVFSEALVSKEAAEQVLAREPEEVCREVRRLLASHCSKPARWRAGANPVLGGSPAAYWPADIVWCTYWAPGAAAKPG